MWQFWIDVGGTFTDCIAVSPKGTFHTTKVLSSGRIKGQLRAGRVSELNGYPKDLFAGWRIESAGDSTSAKVLASRTDGTIETAQSIVDGLVELSCGQIAPLIAIRLTLGLPLTEPIPEIELKLGTTRGTNALLERKGATVGLITTKGFADALIIGTQQRPDLFALEIKKTPPLYNAVAEVDERIAADGSIIASLEANDVEKSLRRLRSDGCQTVAIALVNAYANDSHEQLARDTAIKLGFEVATASTELSRTIQFLPRAETAVLDAYLEPTLRSYVDRLRSNLPGSRIRLMTSAGGLVMPEHFRGTASLVSGPAGGVIGCGTVARAAGLFDGANPAAGAIGFDMGGTSTDVCRVDRIDGIERVRDRVKAGVRIAASTVAIETIAAGGGSICGFDGVKLTVGPASAGADPGPACYGRGGPLTVTDCNVLLGRVLPNQFPFPLDVSAAKQRLQELKQTVGQSDPQSSAASDEEFAEGLFRIATENMAQAVRRVTIANGHDPARDVLVTFGGAGGQYACAVAEQLGCKTVLVHPYAGLLSAFGIGKADERREWSLPVLKPLDAVDVGSLVKAIEASGPPGFDGESVLDETTSYELDLRYQGTESTLTLAIAKIASIEEVAGRFHSVHKSRYGYLRERGIEVVNVRGIRIRQGDQTNFRLDDSRWPAPPEGVANEPIAIADPFSTTVIDPGWSAERLPNGSMVLRHVETDKATQSATPFAVQLELFHSRFGAIAEQMGVVLQNTAVSTNVKERLDFSCAVFDADGHLVVNAPHIPVHLGAMGQTVRELIASESVDRGNVFVTNDPYRGGSHLPDVTVITPVFVDTADGTDSEGDGESGTGNERARFFVASRAHHAEIGGSVPGSIPPNSTSLSEEGVLLRNVRLVNRGKDQTDQLASLLNSGQWPSRNVADNLADITAQAAANQTGVRMLLQLVKRESLETVTRFMQEIRDASAAKTRAALAEWRRQSDDRQVFSTTDQLDDGSPIKVSIAIGSDNATFDFTGTGPVVESNLNANRGIVTAAVLYTLRLLIGRLDSTAASMPLNEGVLDPIELVLPECLLNPPPHDDPRQCAAVVGGNTETSQRVVDVLIKALGLAAASQGTMNNVTFGDAHFGYYETIAGGSGATAESDGASAVQVHMTNTRMTDVEVLEHRYPARVRSFAVRAGSGGDGALRGGDGVSREIEFLAPLSVSLLTGRRETSPFGVEGGTNGQPGFNLLVRHDGSAETLSWRQQIDVSPGDILRIETPGGGGYGSPRED